MSNETRSEPPAVDDHSKLPADWTSRMLRKTRTHPVVDLVQADQLALHQLTKVYHALREPLERVLRQDDAPKAFHALREILECSERNMSSPLFAKTAMIWGHCDKEVIEASPNTLKNFLDASEDILFRTETLARILPDLTVYMDAGALEALPPERRQAYDDLFAIAKLSAEPVRGIDEALKQAYQTYQATPHPEIDASQEAAGRGKRAKQ